MKQVQAVLAVDCEAEGVHIHRTGQLGMQAAEVENEVPVHEDPEIVVAAERKDFTARVAELSVYFCCEVKILLGEGQLVREAGIDDKGRLAAKAGTIERIEGGTLESPHAIIGFEGETDFVSPVDCARGIRRIPLVEAFFRSHLLLRRASHLT